MYLGCLYCKQYGPRSDNSQGNSLIWVHNICFHDKILSEVHLNICSRRKKANKKNIGRLRVKNDLDFSTGKWKNGHGINYSVHWSA